MTEDIKKIIIPVAIAVIFLIAGWFLFYFYQINNQLTLDQAADKAAEFINNNFLEGESEVSLISVEDADSVYRIVFEIEGTEYTSYASKDGKFLFPEGYLMETEESTESEEVLEEESLTGEELEILAKCLTEEGSKFYGSSECVWCQEVKSVFGEAAQYLPYIECLDQETQGITVECQEAGITSYPTWEIGGERTSGYKSPQELSNLSSCKI